MDRPYRDLEHSEIKALFEARRDDREYIECLILELAHRRSASSRRLLADLAAHQASLDDNDGNAEETNGSAATAPTQLSPSTVGGPRSPSIAEDLPAESPLRVFDDLVLQYWEDPLVLQSLLEQISGRWENEAHESSARIRARLAVIFAGGRRTTVETPQVEPSDPIEEVDLLNPTLLTAHPANQPIPDGTKADLIRAQEVAPTVWKPKESSQASQPEQESSRPLPDVWHQVALVEPPSEVGAIRWEVGTPELGQLQAARNDREFELHLAACEWDLDPAILIHSAEDIQARQYWQGTLEPFEHQIKNLITFCRRAPVALLADDVGLGKTISAGLVLSELMARGKVHRTLVLVPKVVLLAQWEEELLAKFGLSAISAQGTELSACLKKSDEIIITTYDSARGRMAELAQGRFDMIIMDEAHKLRNLHGPGSPPVIANRIKEVLAGRVFRYVLMLTATPIQNRLWDLYSLIDLLAIAKGHENPLGNPDTFAVKYIADRRVDARVLNPERRDEFRRILSQYMVRTRRADVNLEFPERHIQMELAVGTPGEQDLFKLVSTFIGDLNPLVQSSVAQALMSSPEALVSQLANMSDRGSVTRQVWESAQAITRSITRTGKQTLLLQLVDRLSHEKPSDWRVVVFTGRRETQKAIGQLLGESFGDDAIGYIRGGDHGGNLRTTREYTQDPPRVHVVVSTESGAEGLNLQAGNVVVNYDLPWNPMMLEQRIGRVQRLGSKHGAVAVLNLVLRDSVEQKVVGRLAERLNTIASTLGDIEGILESLSDGRDGGESIEARIRELVVASLKGVNVESSVRKIQESIERAKQVYEDEKRTVEQHLGKLDAMHDAGPKMPTLSSVAPRMSEREFTLKALHAGEGQLDSLEDDRWRYTVSGYPPEEVVFTRDDLEKRRPRGFAGGSRVSLYLPGQPPFEKLGERWRGRAHHALRDRRGDAVTSSSDAAERWAATHDGAIQVIKLEVQGRAIAFAGEIVIRTAVSVAHDKYEKLVHVPVVPEGIRIPVNTDDNAPILDQAINLAEVAGSDTAFPRTVLQFLGGDPDLRHFAEFYLGRMEEEKEKAGDDRQLLALHEEHYTPRVSSTVVGSSGSIFEVVETTVSFLIDGQGPYTTTLRHLSGTLDLVDAPKSEFCAISGRSLPSAAMDCCSISGTRAVRHALVESSRTKRLALPTHTRTCEATGAVLIEDELEVCAVTGMTVDADLLVSSDVSGRRALESHTSRCEYSGARLLPDEQAVSAVSGNTYRKDEELEGGIGCLRGHPTEFLKCDETGAWLLPAELAESELSGRRVDRRLMVSSEKSGRVIAASESERCDASGAMLARDEVGVCCVTGKTVDLTLLSASEISQKLALPGSMIHCEESNLRMLPSESGHCLVSNQLVDRRLLSSSEVSGQMALKALMVSCALTGKQVLPSELGQCEVTGKRVILDRLFRCDVSGALLLMDECVNDELRPGKRIRRNLASSSEISGRATRSLDVVRCAWDGRTYLPDEVDECALTGLIVGSQYLDEQNRLAVLHAVMRRCESSQSANRPKLREIPLLEIPDVGDIRRLNGLTIQSSPTGYCRAVGGWRPRFLGLRRQHIGLVLDQCGRHCGRFVFD